MTKPRDSKMVPTWHYNFLLKMSQNTSSRYNTSVIILCIIKSIWYSQRDKSSINVNQRKTIIMFTCSPSHCLMFNNVGHHLAVSARTNMADAAPVTHTGRVHSGTVGRFSARSRNRDNGRNAQHLPVAEQRHAE